MELKFVGSITNKNNIKFVGSITNKNRNVCRSNGYQLTTMRSRDDYIQLQLGNATQSLIVTRIRLLPSQEYPEAIEPFS